MADPDPPPLSIEPLSAALLLDHELARRGSLARKGNLTTGCAELDEHVLLGGFQRGSVVGVSAEDDEMGLEIGLKTVARLLVDETEARVLVVTTLPVTVLVPKLREVLVGRLAVGREGMRDVQGRVMGCLERIAISRVFDVQGLGEVLGELGEAVPVGDAVKVEVVPAGDAMKVEVRGERTEVKDSEDEESLSSPSPSPQPDKHHSIPARPALPDMVLITHTSTLLNTLFTGRDKDTAHAAMESLAARLHALTRPSYTGPGCGDEPLIMLLNSTTTSSLGNPASSSTTEDGQSHRRTTEPQTLTSVFNPQPPKHTPATTSHQHTHHHPGQTASNTPTTTTNNPTRPTATTTITNKPSFGQVFAQLLDLHLLLSRVPQTTADRAALAADPAWGVEDVEYAWVVEVLLDEVGVWEPTPLLERGGEGEKGVGVGNEDAVGGRWRGREQRWGVLEGDHGGGL